MQSEADFMKVAIEFLEEIGVDTSKLTPATDLFESEALDSLSTLAYLDFLEEQLGSEIDIEQLEISQVATLQDAHAFVLGRAAA